MSLTVSPQTQQKLESLEALEEALTVIKGISEPRIIWKDSKVYNEKLLKRIFSDDMDSNARAKLLWADQEQRQRLLREHKYADVKKKISEAFDQKKELIEKSATYQSMIFCPFGRILILKMFLDSLIVVFSDGLLVVYERSQSGPFEANEIVALADGSLSCACEATLQPPTPTDDTAADLILFLIAEDAQSPSECLLVRCGVTSSLDAGRKRAVRIDRLQSGNVFGSESCRRPALAVHCPAQQCILTAHDSVVCVIGLASFEIRARLDLAVALRLAPAPAHQPDLHRITSAVTRASQIYASTLSGAVILIQIGAGALRASLLQQYGALQTRVLRADPGSDDAAPDRAGVELDLLPDIAEHKSPIKFSYAPTTIVSMALSRSEALYSACGDGTIRVLNLNSISSDDDQCFLNAIEYGDAGYLPACLQIAVSRSANLLVSCDAHHRLCLWNLTTMEMIGACYMEGIRSPYALHLDPDTGTVVVLAPDLALFWAYDGGRIPGAPERQPAPEPTRSRIR